MSSSPSETYSAVLLFVLGSCRCGRHADTLGLADDRQQSFFHMHREIHRWSLVSTKHSQNVRTRGGYLNIYRCYNGRSRGAQGALSAQRALRGALCTSAPKIGAHSTSLLSTPLTTPLAAPFALFTTFDFGEDYCTLTSSFVPAVAPRSLNDSVSPRGSSSPSL